MRPRDHGFSLVEVLAALSVLAIAGVALTNAMTTSIRSAALARDISLAGIAADNLMALQIAGEDRQTLRDRGGDYELAGVAYTWTLDLEDTSDPNLSRVTLIIERDEREEARRVTFVRGDR